MPMRLLTIAAGLATLPAMPALAQTTHTTSCVVHRNDELRCAMRIPMFGRYETTMSVITRGNGQARGDAHAWSSECGLPGSRTASLRNILNSNNTLQMYRGQAHIGVGNICSEVFITNCRDHGGRRWRARGCSTGRRSGWKCGNSAGRVAAGSPKRWRRDAGVRRISKLLRRAAAPVSGAWSRSARSAPRCPPPVPPPHRRHRPRTGPACRPAPPPPAPPGPVPGRRGG